MATCRGIDVSEYQGAQDWAKHKADGVVFAFAKASEGEHTRDGHFVQHITAIKAAGLVPGAYHFAWPTQDPAKEAANYISAVRAQAGSGFVHWLDLERRGDGRNYVGRSNAQIHDWAAAWITAVEHAFPGQRVGVYTSGDDIAKGHYPSNSDALWYPQYPWGAAPYSKAEAAAHPHPSGTTPLFWQFTSQPLDRSICYLSADGLRAWAGAPKPKPTPGPKPAYEPFPGAAFFRTGHRSPIIAAMHKRLVAVGCNRYKSAANQDVWGSGDVASYAAWQHHLGYTGKAADGIPGKTSWDRLRIPNV